MIRSINKASSNNTIIGAAIKANESGSGGDNMAPTTMLANHKCLR